MNLPNASIVSLKKPNLMKNKKLTRLVTLIATACLFCGGAIAGTFKNISVDGSFADWAGVPLLDSDPLDNPAGVDYSDVYVANDDNYLYIRFTLHAAADPFTFQQNIFIDADNNPGTGYGANGLGSEMLIQSGAGYQEKNGGFNEGGINGLGWAASPSGAGTQFEVRISRAATYASDGTPVFSSGTIALVLESDGSPNEWAPTSPVVYTFESAPVALTTNLPLVRLTSSSWQANAAGTDLGTSWLDQSYDDTQAGWSAGPGLFGYTPTPGAYPAINTALASGPTTYYFRTHFDWNFLVNNLAFVVTNYLSDGAVLYLNGAEVRRVRMPAGAIGYDTNATGSAAPVGQVEVFGISGLPLIIGDNILEVETHQAPGTASDMVFGLSLTAAAQYAVRNVNTNLPADQTVVAGQSVTFTTDVIGSGPLSYQWSHNGASISGATNANLTLTGVLTNDAGSYVLVTTNTLGTNITRAALLTVTNTPVVINDPTQPADAYAVEGQPVTLSVFASGSPRLQYQWFKNNVLVPDATNADYTIAFPVLGNAGNYRVTISNPASSTNSRTASLTVLRDKVPPVITAVAAGASRIVVSFSGPVDATTANFAGNYGLSGGFNVTSAVINPSDASQVTLTTSAPLVLGTIYQLTVNGVSDLFGNIAHTTVSFSRTITIDGSFDDWQGLSPLFSGPIGSAGAADFKDIYVYSDADRYCFRVTLWQDIAPGDGQFPDYVDMFFDTDNDNTTGYPAVGPVGSEMLIESGFGYQEKNGNFNDGSGINGLNWVCLPSAPGTNFEFSISRAATFASDGTAVFTTNVLNFQFVGLKTNFDPLNRAPASGVISFTNMPTVNVPSLPPGRIAIQQLPAGLVALVWDSPGNLQARPSLSGGSWTNVPATSPHVIPASGTQMYFRLSN
jgi:hypothetical protein